MKLNIAVATLCCTASTAFAGGFERSGMPLGFMFEKGNYVELSYGYASPKIGGAAGGGLAPSGDMAESYSTAGLAFKTDLNDQFSLGVTFDPSYGADLNYPNPSPGPGPYPIRGTNAELNGDTIALIGRYKLTDQFSVLAGLRSVGIGGNVEVWYNGAPVYAANYDTDRDLGYLIGAAYEKPEIALRVALTYASETKHDLTTTVFGIYQASETIELPKSLTLDAQSGIAANTLLFGSIRWVDWTSTTLNSYLYTSPPLVSHANDTITYTLGLGRKFNDNWSGAVSVGYEKPAGGIASNLAPTDGFISLGVGGSYTQGNMKISGGVRYVKIGDATALSGASEFTDNSAVGVGLKVGWTF